jgi:hypothetical protein
VLRRELCRRAYKRPSGHSKDGSEKDSQRGEKALGHAGARQRSRVERRAMVDHDGEAEA